MAEITQVRTEAEYDAPWRVFLSYWMLKSTARKVKSSTG